MRELGIQQQKLQDPLRIQIGCVHLAIGLKSRAAAQQANPLLVLPSLRSRLWGVQYLSLVKVEQVGGVGSPLQVAAHLDKLPILAMAHRAVRDALEEMDTIQNCR